MDKSFGVKVRHHRLRTAWVPVAAFAMAGAVVAGGWSAGSAAATSTARRTSPFNLVTSTVRHKFASKIVAITTPYPPAEYLKSTGKVYTGWEITLTNKIMKRLGVHVSYLTAVNTDDIPSVKSGRAQISPGSWTVTPARSKIVNYATDFIGGTQFFVAKSSTLKVSTPGQLCGLTLAVLDATTEQTRAQAQSKKCTAAGKQPIAIQDYPTEASVTLAIGAGRAQVGWTGAPQAEYLVGKQPTKFKLAGKQFTETLHGIVVSKTLPGLAKAIAAEMNVLIKNGTYHKILAKWGVSSEKVTHSVAVIKK
ncbi:MAG: transporter substrate-binding domain-containing protein [Acidimicrobiales bacterium]